MAFRKTHEPGQWYQEQKAYINEASETELAGLSSGVDKHYEEAVTTLMNTLGVNVTKDAKAMVERPEVMQEFKTVYLEPILQDLREYNATNESEKIHLESVADQLEAAWDSSAADFIQESYNVANYLPLATLDFPALVKQYIRFLGKDIIPVQTANSTNIEMRIFKKYLVNNQTGEEYETPAIYFQKDENGESLWKKIWNAGKGYRINDKKPITFAELAAAPGKKIQLLQSKYLLDENGNEPTDFKKTIRTRLSYNFNIRYVQLDIKESYVVTTSQPDDWSTAYTSYYTTTDNVSYTAVSGGSAPAWEANKYYKKIEASTPKVQLPGGGIQIDIQNGGIFTNGTLSADKPLAVVDPETNKRTGETVAIDAMFSGVVDFVKGTVAASVCGDITGFYIDGYISNETNLRTIGFREYPELRKFKIADGCRFQVPFTVEDFKEATAVLDFNVYNRLTQEVVTASEMFEDEYILQTLDSEFDKYDGVDTNIWDLESYTHTEYVDLDPTSISPSFAGDPYEYRTSAIHNALNSVIYELCDKGKLDNLGFVIYANPKACRLLKEFVTWSCVKTTAVAGVTMNHSFGVMTDSEVPIRVVSSNRVPAYITIDAYQKDDPNYTETAKSKEYFFKIVAYPMDKFHISYKHYRFARHLTNSPENAGYQDAQNPGGQAVLVTTSAQYETVHIQGIQGRVICKNTSLVPDANAGLIRAE